MCGACVSCLDHESSKITKTHEGERHFQERLLLRDVFVSFYEAAVEIKPVRVLYHSVVRATLALRRDPFILLFALFVTTSVVGAV